MKKTFVLVALAAVMAASASIALAAPQGDIGTVTFTVQLGALNGSGETGTATFSKHAGSQTIVTLSLTHVPGGANQPAHVHTGNCGATLGGVKYPLANVKRPFLTTGPASSTIIINVPIDSLEGGSFAVNVHRSSAPGPLGIGHYMACGNLP